MKNLQFYTNLKKTTQKQESWGIAELKQYPLNNKQEIKTAEAHFSFCPQEYKIELAANIIRKAYLHAVDINNPEVLEWASRWY
ncbi:MAG: hypothetical protein R3Y38_04615 [Rikenellaceae bacterium]